MLFHLFSHINTRRNPSGAQVLWRVTHGGIHTVVYLVLALLFQVLNKPFSLDGKPQKREVRAVEL